MRVRREASLTGYVVLFAGMLCLFLFMAGESVKHLAVQADASGQRMPKIVIDAGHGGEDGGTAVNGLSEKDINLPVAQTLQALFLSGGFEVEMIRDSDVDLGDPSLQTVRERKASDLRKRAELVNAAGDCILISIHQNYFEQSRYRGTQVFYAAGNEGSDVLAQCIQDTVQSLMQPENTRQIKEGNGIYLLEHISVPAVIVECGFLSNPEEAALLSREEYRQKMALCIYSGVCSYLEQKQEITPAVWFEIPG